MNSPFANIYTALQERIATEVPEIIYSDLDYGQLETPERPAVVFPCVIMNFEQFRFSELSQLSQQAEGAIIFKLAADPYSSTSNITPDTYKEAGLYILELEWLLYKALQGWKPITIATPLIRTAYTPDNRRPGLRVQQMAFTTSFQDHSAKRPTTLINPPPPVIIPGIITSP